MKNELVFVKQEADRGQLTDFVGHKEYDLEKKELKKD